MTKKKIGLLIITILMLMPVMKAFSQPIPGDVFREYMWTKEDGDAGGSLRVGGQVGYDGGAISLDHDFDLEYATKAEVVIEKIQCHDGTTGLGIQINDGDWIYIPEPATIPVPRCTYQHHFYPRIRFPLNYLKQGKGNTFRMKVDEKHPWNWPQNLVYGVHFRIYYDPDKKPHPTGRIVNPESGQTVGHSVKLAVEASSPNGQIERVDYVGLYEDVNFEGDGVYRQWHYHFFHGHVIHHLGSATSAPYDLTWDTSWVPDQKQPMRIAARVKESTGIITMTEAIDNLRLMRPGLSVEMCKPYDIPPKWVTRSGEKEERFEVAGELDKAVAAQLVWSSWSPGYMNGVYINGVKVFDNEGPRYQYYAHRVTIENISCFKKGVNVLKTGKTPKYDGKMMHGMEVNWPGIMVLIQYQGDKK